MDSRVKATGRTLADDLSWLCGGDNPHARGVLEKPTYGWPEEREAALEAYRRGEDVSDEDLRNLRATVSSGTWMAVWYQRMAALRAGQPVFADRPAIQERGRQARANKPKRVIR